MLPQIYRQLLHLQTLNYGHCCSFQFVTSCLSFSFVYFLEPSRHFTYVIAHSPTLPSLYLCHSSFSNPSVASPMSQLILQPFFRFSYVTGSSLTSPGEPPMSHIDNKLVNYTKVITSTAVFNVGNSTKQRTGFNRSAAVFMRKKSVHTF